MKLVIEIPKTIYDSIKCKTYYLSQVTEICKSISDSTPLPKGHGRIIDESKIEVCEWVDAWEEDYPKASTDAPTIIEADGGGEE